MQQSAPSVSSGSNAVVAPHQSAESASTHLKAPLDAGANATIYTGLTREPRVATPDHRPSSDLNAIAERERGLHRELSAGQLGMIAIGGAIGTGLFLGSSFAISFAGPAVLISYAIGGVIALLLMGCLAEMTTAHPASGGFGAFAEVYLGPLAGFLVRYSYWSAVVLAVGTEVTAIAVYMRFWYPAVPGLVWIALFSAVLVAANAANVRVFGSVEYLFSLIKVLAIVAFIALGSFVVFARPHGLALARHHLLNEGGFLPHGLSGMWIAVVISIFSYFSLEMIAVAAGEARDPARAIQRAFRATLLRLVLFYLLSLVLTLAIIPWTDAGAGGSPFVRVMAASRIPAAAAIVNAVILVAALSAMNSQLYITTRMMFSLSRAGQAPRRFGHLSTRGVPLTALALSTVGIAVAAVLAVVSPATAFTLMMSISMFGAMFTWLMIFVTHLVFRRRYQPSEPRFRMWGYPATTIVGIVLMAALLITTAFTSVFRLTLVYGMPFLGLLLGAYALQSRSHHSDTLSTTIQPATVTQADPSL